MRTPKATTGAPKADRQRERERERENTKGENWRFWSWRSQYIGVKKAREAESPTEDY